MIGVQKTTEELSREMETLFQRAIKEKKGKKVRKKIDEQWNSIQRTVAQMQGNMEEMKKSFASERKTFEENNREEFPDVYVRSLQERLAAQERQILKKMEELQEEFKSFLKSL